MLTSIRLLDFKGHRDTLVPLGRFTALVGPNGSGKTSVLEALWLQGKIGRMGRRLVACRPAPPWGAGTDRAGVRWYLEG